MEGKIKPDLRLFEREEFSKILPLTDETMQFFNQKHSNATHQTSYCKNQLNTSVLYSNATLIRKYANEWNL